MQQQPLNYLIATHRKSKMTDSFMLGSSGLVCRRCAAVVIDPDVIRELLSFSHPNWNVGTQFMIPGLVDLDAIPEEKAHLPLGDDDNPLPVIPLVFPEEK